MIKFFKQLFKRRDLDKEIEMSCNARELVEDKKYNVAYFMMNRHYLFSLSPKDFDNVFDGMDENAKREYLAQASTIWANPVFLSEIKHIMAMQSLFVSSNTQNWDQSLVGRGTINGIGLMEERFKLLHSMHLENIKSPNMVEGNEEVIPQV